MMHATVVGWLALAGTALASPVHNSRSRFNWHSTKALLAFGDSYTYVQGLLGQPNYTYIGNNFDISFTPEKLFSNRIVQNHTSTAEGGPNWVEFLTDCAVQPGLTDPRTCKVQLWDFAFGGANTEEVITPLHHNFTVSLERQIEQLVRYGDPALSPILDKKDTLVAFWIGINDINDIAKLGYDSATFPELYGKVQTRVFELVDTVYGLGYRNFLFMNLPPLNRCPRPAVNSTLVSLFNGVHASHADAFQASHPSATILQYDVNSVLNGVLDNYQSYGFTNITNYCPGYNKPDIWTDPDKYGCDGGLDRYFWYDGGHLGSRTHQIFTADLRKFLFESSRWT